MPDFLRSSAAIAEEATKRKGWRPVPSGVPPLQTSQPTDGIEIPELGPTLRREDVPLPQGLPLPEAPEKVGKGKKALRGLRDLIPIIAKLAQGAQTQQPGFLGALGEQFSRAQAEPARLAAIDQEFRAGEAGIAKTIAETGGHEAGTRQKDVDTGLAPGLAEAQIGELKSREIFRGIQAEHEKAMTDYRRMYTKYMPEKSRAEIDALVAKATAERMRTTLSQYDLDMILPAQWRALEALTGLRDIQKEFYPEKVQGAIDFKTWAMGQTSALKERGQADTRDRDTLTGIDRRLGQLYAAQKANRDAFNKQIGSGGMGGVDAVKATQDTVWKEGYLSEDTRLAGLIKTLEDQRNVLSGGGEAARRRRFESQ